MIISTWSLPWLLVIENYVAVKRECQWLTSSFRLMRVFIAENDIKCRKSSISVGNSLPYDEKTAKKGIVLTPS